MTLFYIHLLTFLLSNIFEEVRSKIFMNIFKTFETFLKEPLSILKDNFIQIISLQTGNIFADKPSVDVSVMKDRTQITVVNNEKLYKFLSIVNKKNLQTKEEILNQMELKE